MAERSYDVVLVGGGIAGSSLARALAGRGARVLVLERDTVFKDRVRGEQMQPWGVAEASALGVFDLLDTACGHHQPWVDLFLGGAQLAHRNLVETTPQRAPHFNFFHPRAQEVLLQAASVAGAKVERGATVTAIVPGSQPSVTYQRANQSSRQVDARLVVAADGRTSMARQAARFAVKRDPQFLALAGVLLDGMTIAEDTGLIYMNPALSRGAYLFPQGRGRVRAYVAHPMAEVSAQGAEAWPRFVEIARSAGAPAGLFDGAVVAGPLASFDATDVWVEHPFTEGVALVGDAAASNDPSWGQGLSLTFRDARVLHDCLLDTTDWTAAGHAYAAAHDHHYGVIHEVTQALKDVFMRSGPDADARRARALPVIAQDPMRVPDHAFAGPDLPWSPGVRARFLAES
jgi:2-polyprenyl-6-methoxyphenol hydroxylase-like FAD-dependent oxidoreductase